MEIALPGHDQANPVLADHIESLDLQKAQMTTDYLTDNLFDEQHPAIQWNIKIIVTKLGGVHDLFHLFQFIGVAV